MASELRKGDTIKCGKDEIVDIMTDLERNGVETDFLYELNGQKGYWLEVKRVHKLGFNPYQE